MRIGFSVFVASVFLAGCSLENMPLGSRLSANKGPGIDQAGTCFALVTKEDDGSYTLMTGVGDGSRNPNAVKSAGLTAAKVDAAVAKEVAIMKINPECLATHVVDRAQVDGTAEKVAAN